MTDPESSLLQATLEVFSKGTAPRSVSITTSPFEIGRSGPTEGRLAMSDSRISRQAAVVTQHDGRFHIQDAGQRKGLFLNDRAVEEPTPLDDGDVVTFGTTDDVHLVFRTGSERESISNLLSRLDETAGEEGPDQSLGQLSLLLEATALLQAAMPVEEVLGAMVDQAITITEADRGTLFEAESAGGLRPLVVRKAGGVGAATVSSAPSQTAIDQALSERRAFIELDLDLAGDSVKTAASIVNQRLRSVIAIPLYSRFRRTDSTNADTDGELLGLLYLDSRRPAAFRGLGRRVLDALAFEAGRVLDNARLMERERDRQRMEHDLDIARSIQQRLLPKAFRTNRFLEVTGTNEPCQSVGGDYFDVVAMGPGRAACVIADVTGKGLAAALLTAMVQGGFSGISLTPDPARLVSHLNRYVWGRSEPNRFATAVVGVFDETGTLEYINAGHLPALLFRSSGEMVRLVSGALPLGIFADTEFTAVRIALEEGDTLVMFTDGVTEARNLKGEAFGIGRLSDIVRASAARPVADIQAAITTAVSDFSQGAELDDDMTLLIVRYVGAGAASAG